MRYLLSQMNKMTEAKYMRVIASQESAIDLKTLVVGQHRVKRAYLPDPGDLPELSELTISDKTGFWSPVGVLPANEYS